MSGNDNSGWGADMETRLILLATVVTGGLAGYLHYSGPDKEPIDTQTVASVSRDERMRPFMLVDIDTGAACRIIISLEGGGGDGLVAGDNCPTDFAFARNIAQAGMTDRDVLTLKSLGGETLARFAPSDGGYVQLGREQPRLRIYEEN